MTQPDNTLIERARNGDVQAIATIINRRTQPKGVTTKVLIKGDCLQLLLESQEAPDQQAVATFARNLLTSLNISGVCRVKLYGRKKGDEFPAWNIEFEIVRQNSDQTASPSSQSSSTLVKPVSTPIKTNTTSIKSSSKFGGSFQLSSSLPKTPEQQKIAKSKAYEYGIAGAVLGLIISLPSVWAALQMLQIEGGGDFTMGYVIGIGVVVFIGYLSGFSQGSIQFGVDCPNCEHKFILSGSGGNCPACNAGLYIDERGNCQVRL